MLFTFYRLEQKCLHSRNVWKKNTPDTPDLLLEDKVFHNNLCLLVTTSALLYLLHLLLLHKSLVYPPFIYASYDECSDERRYAMRN